MVLAGFWGFGVLALCLLAQSMNRDVFEQRHIVERLARAVDQLEESPELVDRVLKAAG